MNQRDGVPSRIEGATGDAASDGQPPEEPALDADQWRTLLSTQERPNITISVETFEELLPGFSKSCRVRCSDKEHYAVKGPQSGQAAEARAAVNEQVAGLLGLAIGAPIPPLKLVTLGDELRAATPELQHFASGLLHASRWQNDCTGRMDAQYFDESENRSRFAAIAIFFTWLYAHDHQFIYQTVSPHLVWTHDHGHFISNGSVWTAAYLQAIPPVTELDTRFTGAALTPEELSPYYERLATVNDERIARAVARPPDEWGVSMEERVALCEFLSRRRREVLSLRPMP